MTDGTDDADAKRSFVERALGLATAGDLARGGDRIEGSVEGAMAGSEAGFETRHLGAAHDDVAPDSSEIRLLATAAGGSMAHGTLPPKGVSLAIRHRTVEELWYVTAGRGQVWRKQGEREEVVDVGPGSSLSIPVGTHFQFRNTGWEPLCFVMCTMPPWPGSEEAVRVPHHWPVGGTAAADAANQPARGDRRGN